MSDKFYRIITRDNRRNVMALAWEASGTLLASQESIVVEVRGKKRSDEQNAKLHASLIEYIEAWAADNGAVWRALQDWRTTGG